MDVIYLLSTDHCSRQSYSPVRFFPTQEEAEAYVAAHPPSEFADFVIERVTAGGYIDPDNPQTPVGPEVIGWYPGRLGGILEREGWVPGMAY